MKIPNLNEDVVIKKETESISLFDSVSTINPGRKGKKIKDKTGKKSIVVTVWDDDRAIIKKKKPKEKESKNGIKNTEHHGNLEPPLNDFSEVSESLLEFKKQKKKLTTDVTVHSPDLVFKKKSKMFQTIDLKTNDKLNTMNFCNKVNGSSPHDESENISAVVKKQKSKEKSCKNAIKETELHYSEVCESLLKFKKQKKKKTIDMSDSHIVVKKKTKKFRNIDLTIEDNLNSVDIHNEVNDNFPTNESQDVSKVKAKKRRKDKVSEDSVEIPTKKKKHSSVDVFSENSFNLDSSSAELLNYSAVSTSNTLQNIKVKEEKNVSDFYENNGITQTNLEIKEDEYTSNVKPTSRKKGRLSEDLLEIPTKKKKKRSSGSVSFSLDSSSLDLFNYTPDSTSKALKNKEENCSDFDENSSITETNLKMEGDKDTSNVKPKIRKKDIMSDDLLKIPTKKKKKHSYVDISPEDSLGLDRSNADLLNNTPPSTPKKPKKGKVKKEKKFADFNENSSIIEENLEIKDEDISNSSNDFSEEINGNDASNSIVDTDNTEEVTDRIMLMEIKNLHIKLNFDVPKLHELLPRSTNPTVRHKTLISDFDLKVKSGKFSSNEDKIIKENWYNFINLYELEDKPYLFFSLKKKIITEEQKRRFIWFLAQKLPERTPVSVFKRFKRLFTTGKKCGRFSPEEDDYIRKILEETDCQPGYITQIAKYLNRSLHSVSKRVDKMKHAHTRRILWKPKNMAAFIRYLIKVTHSENVKNLENRSISTPEWNKLSRKLDHLPVRILQRVWWEKIHPRLFIPKKCCDLNKMRIKLAKLLHKNNEKEWKTVNWSLYVSHFKGLTALKLYILLKSCARIRVPLHKQKSLKDCLNVLITVDPKQLKRAVLYKIKYENGQVIEYKSKK